jgi:hypothetical protein
LCWLRSSVFVFFSFAIDTGAGVEDSLSPFPITPIFSATMSSRQQIDSVIDDDDEFWYVVNYWMDFRREY